jgi:excisionase family DNA binding protein
MGLLSILFNKKDCDKYNCVMPEWITVKQAAGILVVKTDRVRKLCRAGKLTAAKFGDVWQVDRESVIAYKKTYRKPGPKPDVIIRVNEATKTAVQSPRKRADDDGSDIPY